MGPVGLNDGVKVGCVGDRVGGGVEEGAVVGTAERGAPVLVGNLVGAGLGLVVGAVVGLVEGEISVDIAIT